MELLDESELFRRLRSARNVFLLEPPYRSMYPPLGLAKIAAYVKRHGGEVTFGRKYVPGAQPHDLICVTSLFTYDAEAVFRALHRCRVRAPGVPVILGGIFATLMPDYVKVSAPGVDIFPGYSKELDSCVPDWTVNWRTRKPWQDFSFVFTSRGCSNKCVYCAVPKLEGKPWVNPTWQSHILSDRPNVVIGDNNLLSCDESHYMAVLAYLAEMKKGVLVDSGLDAKCVSESVARALGRLRSARHGIRLAFDRIGEEKDYRTAVRRMVDAGVCSHNIITFVLFNFKETPQEAHYRIQTCLQLICRPYPQQFMPLMKTTRGGMYVGKQWTEPLVRAFRDYNTIKPGLWRSVMTFEDFCGGPGAKYKLGEADWAAWYKDEEKWKARAEEHELEYYWFLKSPKSPV